MGFIRSGFTGGFLGIVISIANLFVDSNVLDKASSVGLYVATLFGKACIGTCTLAEKFTTLLATIVGNTIAYFVIFALLSLAFTSIKMLFTRTPQEQPQAQQPVQQVVVQQPQAQVQQPQQQPQEEPKPEVKEEAEDSQEPQRKEVKQSKQKKKQRPTKKAKVRKTKN